MRASLDRWEEWDFACPKCDWKGKGSQLSTGDWSETGCEELCPACGEMIAWLEFPLVEDLMKNFDQLSPADQAMAVVISKGHREWKSAKLTNPDQLPEIVGEYFALVWDEDEHAKEIVIRNGREEVFRHVASWEYHQYFVTACRILKQKYGYRLLDVIPTPRALCGMAGDCLCEEYHVKEMRRLMALDIWPVDSGSPETDKARKQWITFESQYD